MTTKTAIIILIALWAVSMAFAAYAVFRPGQAGEKPAAPVTGHVFSVRYFAVEPTNEATANLSARWTADGETLTFLADGDVLIEQGVELRRTVYEFDGKKLTFNEMTYNVEEIPGGLLLTGNPEFILILRMLQ